VLRVRYHGLFHGCPASFESLPARSFSVEQGLKVRKALGIRHTVCHPAGATVVSLKFLIKADDNL
jgi:hypothetical protein